MNGPCFLWKEERMKKGEGRGKEREIKKDKKKGS
jgi:hypothetical protein